MNSIFVIRPYKKEGIWMFDDANVGLLAEPFVGNTNKIIDESSKHIANKWLGVQPIFCYAAFPWISVRVKLETRRSIWSLVLCRKLRSGRVALSSDV